MLTQTCRSCGHEWRSNNSTEPCPNCHALREEPRKEWDKPIEAESNGHKWFKFAKDTFQSCRICGMIRRHDDRNLTCKGRPKINLKGGVTADDYCPRCGMLRSQCDCWDPVNQI